MLPWNDLDEAKASEAQPPEQSDCSTSTTVTVGQRAINSQSVRRTASQSRPERRSNDGRPILNPVQMTRKPHPELLFLVGYGDSSPRPLRLQLRKILTQNPQLITELAEMLPPARQASATGDRSVAIAGDSTAPISTGD